MLSNFLSLSGNGICWHSFQQRSSYLLDSERKLFWNYYYRDFNKIKLWPVSAIFALTELVISLNTYFLVYKMVQQTWVLKNISQVHGFTQEAIFLTCFFLVISSNDFKSLSMNQYKSQTSKSQLYRLKFAPLAIWCLPFLVIICADCDCAMQP